MRKILGGILIAIGLLLVVITLIVTVSYGAGGGLTGILFVTAFSGSLPIAVGLRLFIGGRALSRSGKTPKSVGPEDIKGVPE